MSEAKQVQALLARYRALQARGEAIKRQRDEFAEAVLSGDGWTEEDRRIHGAKLYDLADATQRTEAELDTLRSEVAELRRAVEREHGEESEIVGTVRRLEAIVRGESA